MARNVLGWTTALTAALVTIGCSSGGPIVSVLQGNMAYSRGDYQTALVRYLSTREDEAQRGWLLFNAANVYYALGEQEAALVAWNDARSAAVGSDDSSRGGSTLLIHAASYNRGVLLHERGEYRGAYDEFRYALSVNPRSAVAKVNLELALQKIRSAEQAEQRGGGPADDVGGEDAGQATLRILEYVRRKEAQRWFANRESDDTSHQQDW